MTIPPEDPSLDPASRAMRLRRMNDLVRERRDAFGDEPVQAHVLMCECADPSCSAMLKVDGAELDAVRREPDLFIVDIDHVGSAEVVSSNRRHSIVRMPRT